MVAGMAAADSAEVVGSSMIAHLKNPATPFLCRVPPRQPGVAYGCVFGGFARVSGISRLSRCFVGEPSIGYKFT